MQFCSHSLTALRTGPLPTASAPGVQFAQLQLSRQEGAWRSVHTGQPLQFAIRSEGELFDEHHIVRYRPLRIFRLKKSGSVALSLMCLLAGLQQGSAFVPCGTCAGDACGTLNVRMAQRDIPQFNGWKSIHRPIRLCSCCGP